MSAKDLPTEEFPEEEEDEEEEEDDPDFPKPPFPYYSVMSHVVGKGLQAGSFLGILTGPLYLTWAKNLTAATFSRYVMRATAGAAVLTMALGVGRLATVDAEGLEDRAYRLRYNRRQNECDSVAFTSGFSAGVVGATLGTGSRVRNFTRWGSVGVGLGLVGYLAFTTLVNPKEY